MHSVKIKKYEIITMIYCFFYRFLSSFKIKVASHAKQRKIHKELHGENWSVEMAPFMHKKDKTEFEEVTIPWAHINDLQLHISDRLDSMKK